MDKTASKQASSTQKKENKNLTKSQLEKKSQKEKQKQAKDKKAKEQQEKDKQEAYAKRLRDVRAEYKDPHQLSEGEIMIVIEHSDDPGRVLMSTSHDYDKYKRISSKIRQWIMRDFPSMKVIIKPNNHQKDNKRIGCFEISYFHMREGELHREDIFSKMVDRKWPKWKNVQERIKKFVKNSSLVVQIEDVSAEKKKQFQGMVIHIKNVLFAKHASNTLSQSSMVTSMPPAEPELTPFKEMVATGSGELKFENLPVGNYAIVFAGNRTYKPVTKPFQVSATEPLIKETLTVDVVEEGFFSIEINTYDIQEEKYDIDTKINLIPNPPKQTSGEKATLEGLLKKKAELDAAEKKAKQYKISLIPTASKGVDTIPISCEKTQIQGGTDHVFEAVVEPGEFDVVLTSGLETKVLQSGAKFTRGENKFVLDVKSVKMVDEKKFKEELEKKKAAKAKQEEEDEKKANTKPAAGNTGGATQGAGNTGAGNTGAGNTGAGNTGAGNTGAGNTGAGNTGAGNTGAGNTGAGNTGGATQGAGNTGTNAGRTRPETSGTNTSETEDSHNRLNSADFRQRPGSASILNKTQDQVHTQHAINHQTIDEKPEEEDEKFMVKMLVTSDRDELPFDMQFLYEDEEGITHEISKDAPPAEGGLFQAERQRQVLVLSDVHQREGFYRMILTKRPDAPFSPVHIMINCGAASFIKKFTQDIFFNTDSELFFDFGVFKCTLLSLSPRQRLPAHLLADR